MRIMVAVGLLFCARTVAAAPATDPPLAPPSATAPVSEPPEASPSGDRCDSGAYLEPTLLFGSYGASGVSMLNRIAAGVVFRDCDARRRATTHARVGATIYLSKSARAGAGFEAEGDHSVSRTWRLGLRVGAESVAGDGHLYSFGARAHVSDTMFLELDVARATHYDVAPTTTVMGGLGFEGRPGAYVAATELGVGTVLFLLLINALANTR